MKAKDEIEVGDVYEDECGNVYEISDVNPRHVHVTPLDETLRFTRKEFNENFVKSEDDEE